MNTRNLHSILSVFAVDALSVQSTLVPMILSTCGKLIYLDYCSAILFCVLKIVIIIIIIIIIWFVQYRVSLCSPVCPGTHVEDQAGLELRNPPASASQVLGLKACATVLVWYSLTHTHTERERETDRQLGGGCAHL